MSINPLSLRVVASGGDAPTLKSAMTQENSQESVHDLISQDDAPVETVIPAKAQIPVDPGLPLQTIQTPGIPEVYVQAGVRIPAHGFSILKIADMLSSVHIKDLTPDAKRAAILLALEASNIQLNEVIEDASRRERVLNDYEARQQQIFQNYKNGKQQHSQQTQAEIERLIEQLKALIQANEKEVSSEKARLDEWRTKKREEERRIKAAASLFGNTLAQQPAADTIPMPSVPQVDAPAATAPAANRAAASSPTDIGAAKTVARPSLWKR